MEYYISQISDSLDGINRYLRFGNDSYFLGYVLPLLKWGIPLLLILYFLYKTIEVLEKIAGRLHDVSDNLDDIYNILDKALIENNDYNDTISLDEAYEKFSQVSEEKLDGKCRYSTYDEFISYIEDKFYFSLEPSKESFIFNYNIFVGAKTAILQKASDYDFTPYICRNGHKYVLFERDDYNKYVQWLLIFKMIQKSKTYDEFIMTLSNNSSNIFVELFDDEGESNNG